MWAGASFSRPECYEACRHLNCSQKSLALPKFRGVGQEGTRMDRGEESHSRVKGHLNSANTVVSDHLLGWFIGSSTCLEAVGPGWSNWLKILHLTCVRGRTWEEVGQEAGSQSKAPCWTGSSEQQGFDSRLDGEQNSLELAVGPWQGPLVLSLGSHREGRLQFFLWNSANPLLSWWREITQVPAHRVQSL